MAQQLNRLVGGDGLMAVSSASDASSEWTAGAINLHGDASAAGHP